MEKKVKVAISSAGGYGYYYLRSLLDEEIRSDFEIVSVFDPNILNLPVFKELNDRSIPTCSDYDTFLKSLDNADLAVIVSPIHYHANQSIDALKRGCNVLLDKPLAGSYEQAEKISSNVSDSGKWIMLGYQWTFSDSIQRLKRDLVNKRFGSILKAKTLVFWPRGYDYYARNNWAGIAKTASGQVVNDSLLNNAMAHFLHNLLYLCGNEQDLAAEPINGMAELYRVYPIETYDTAVLHLSTKQGPEIGFYGSHATKNLKGPLFLVECADATIYYGELSNEIVAIMNDGQTESYGDPESTDQFNKLWVAIDRCKGLDGYRCTLDAAVQQTKVIDALAEQVKVVNFCQEHVKEISGERKFVEGLGYMLLSSYQQWAMPTDQKFTIKGTKQSITI